MSKRIRLMVERGMLIDYARSDLISTTRGFEQAEGGCSGCMGMPISYRNSPPLRVLFSCRNVVLWPVCHNDINIATERPMSPGASAHGARHITRIQTLHFAQHTNAFRAFVTTTLTSPLNGRCPQVEPRGKHELAHRIERGAIKA